VLPNIDQVSILVFLSLAAQIDAMKTHQVQNTIIRFHGKTTHLHSFWVSLHYQLFAQGITVAAILCKYSRRAKRSDFMVATGQCRSFMQRRRQTSSNLCLTDLVLATTAHLRQQQPQNGLATGKAIKRIPTIGGQGPNRKPRIIQALG
jgi:hypothetical protein